MDGAQQFMNFMSANPLPKDSFDRGVAAFLMLPAYARNAMAQKRLDNTDLAGTLDVPLLAVLGSADQTQSVAALRHATAGAKHVRVVVYDGVGHSAFAEATGRFDADLADFASEIGMGSRAGDPVAVARRYVAAVNAGDAEGALRMFDDDAVMYLNGGRIARGREALRAIESFHAVVRPSIEPQGLSVRITDGQAVVSVARVVESSRIFSAMGLPTVTTEAVDDGFVIKDGQIVSARQPEFAEACRTVMAAAMTAVRGWLVTRHDSRLDHVLPGGVPRMDAATAQAWISALEDWRSATGWKPDPAAQLACAGVSPSSTATAVSNAGAARAMPAK
jgi:hypothetical protein